jgi:hypothetical protein
MSFWAHSAPTIGEKMPHPIYGAPQHELLTVDFKLDLPTRDNDHVTKLTVWGRSTTSRSALWRLHEAWEWGEQVAGQQPSDSIAHALLVAYQDRPTSQAQVEACMVGEGWNQPTLFD